jgi:hypothetical protein
VTDEALLTDLRRYEDAQAGISEEFFFPAIGSKGALDVLSRPLVKSRSVGWIICPSLGKERSYLRRLEALVARRLAAEGFPVVRIRNGQGNHIDGARELSLSTRLAEVERAAKVLASLAEVKEIGAAGALAGGMVAALASERMGLSLLAAWEPVVRGSQYLKDAFRRQSVSALVAGEESDAAIPTRQSLDELASQGWTRIRGFRLTRETHDQISALDLTQEMATFRGPSLLVGISRTGEPGSALRRLYRRLEEIGGSPTLLSLQDPLMTPFGESYFRDEGLVRVDARLDLDRELADALVAWASNGRIERTSGAPLA